MLIRILLGTAAVAAVASAAPASAQYYSGYTQPTYGYQQPTYTNRSYGYAQQYGTNGYRYAQPYGNAYGYNQSYGYAQPNAYGQAYGYGAADSGMATQQCTAAVQSRLANRNTLSSILGAVLGTSTGGGQVVGITQVNPRGNGMTTVRGLANSGRYASNGYGAYGQGAYGALGYGYQNAADLSFRCDVDYRGYVTNVTLRRR